MTKNIRSILTVVLLLLVSISYSQRRSSQPVEFKKISANLYEIPGGRGSSAGAYIGDNGVLLIDSKMDENSVSQVIEGIKKITDKPIKYLVNTHSDGDHIAGNRYLPGTVTFVAHQNCRKDFFGPDRRGNPSEWNKPELSPFVPSVTYRDKMTIHLGSKKVELWYFGVGHTTGDTVLYFPEEKTAFIGDQIFLTRPQLIHSYKGGNSFEHVKTLTKMLETIDAEKFCSGHSEMADRPAIKSHIAQMKKRQQKVKALISNGRTLEEIKNEFPEEEARLIETIYNEIKPQQAEKTSARTIITSQNISRIAGMQWILEKMTVGGEEYKLAREKPFIKFGEYDKITVPWVKVTGSGSVNRFFGSMEIDAQGNVRWQKAFGSTRMAGPPDFMKQENIFLRALPKTELLSLKGIRLHAATKDGKTELVFYVPV